jgi:branched-chain amino acid transport system ATP-binding protein
LTGARGAAGPVLHVDGVSAGYARVPVIKDVSVLIGKGDIVLVIGPNGAGKSTLVKAIIGELPLMSGSVRFRDMDIGGLSEDVRAGHGIGYVPQLRDVFPTLTVLENLEMGGYSLGRAQAKNRIAELFDRFPQLVPLRGRLVRRLSGGERKLVAVARALVPDPVLLILDEPTANLAPRIARQVLTQVVRGLADTGGAILLIEQRVELALEVASWVNVLVDGRLRRSGPAEDFRHGKAISEVFFGDVLAASSKGSDDSGN